MSDPRRAVILAAGRGSRLGSHTEQLPKCLLPLGDGTTLLGRQLTLLAQRGVERVLVVAGYRAERIEAALVDVARPSVTLRRNERWASTGSAASLLQAEDWLCASDDGPLLVAHGDLVYEPAVLGALLAAPAPATLLDTSWRALTGDEVVGDHAHGRLTALRRAPPREDGAQGEFVGLSVFPPEVAAAFAARCRHAAPGDDYELPVLHAFVAEERAVVHAVTLARPVWRNVNDDADLDAARAMVATLHA